MRFFGAAIHSILNANHEGSQRGMVQRTGINKGTISKYAAGNELPSAPNLRRLMTKYPAHRSDLATALVHDLLEDAGASDLRVTIAGAPNAPGDTKTEALVARISDRLRRDPKFRQVIAQLTALG